MSDEDARHESVRIQWRPIDSPRFEWRDYGQAYSEDEGVELLAQLRASTKWLEFRIVLVVTVTRVIPEVFPTTITKENHV